MEAGLTARILVADDSAANVKLLRAVLAAEYFDVITASDGPQALIHAAQLRPDCVLLDGMMPGMSGFEVCRRIKSAPGSSHVPVLLVTTLDQPADRVAALEAGADDLVAKPIDRALLIARVRNAVRTKGLFDALRLRAVAPARRAEDPSFLGMSSETARILLIEDQRDASEPIRLALGARHRVRIERDAEDALLLAQRAEFDVIAVDLSLGGSDGLRVCARLRALEATRYVPMLVVARDWSAEARVRALDLGVNGFVSLPLHPGELYARVGSLVRRKRYWDRLCAGTPLAAEWRAAAAELPGLPDRKHLEQHLAPLVASNVARGRPVSLLLIDVDPLERVGESLDSEVGDEVLREVARRISVCLRELDLACRFGGEEFVAAFPGVDAEAAQQIGERLRQRVGDEPLPLATPDGPLRVSISIGLATTSGEGDTADALLGRADLALHRARKEGRDRVVARG